MKTETIHQAAERIGCTVGNLSQLIRKKKYFKSAKKISDGKTMPYLIDSKEVDDYIKNRPRPGKQTNKIIMESKKKKWIDSICNVKILNNMLPASKKSYSKLMNELEEFLQSHLTDEQLKELNSILKKNGYSYKLISKKIDNR